jgi:hypothetical protein
MNVIFTDVDDAMPHAFLPWLSEPTKKTCGQPFYHEFLIKSWPQTLKFNDLIHHKKRL